MFVLVHSPSVGPSTWRPVADRLASLGRDAVVPSLRRVAEAPPPYWPVVVDVVVDAVVDALAGAGGPAPGGGGERPLVLVAHSNAGLFVPVLVAGLGDRVAGCVFVDAALPPPAGEAPAAPPEFLALLREKASGGILPRWTDWWDEEDVARLLPDERTRRTVIDDQPMLPLAYYEASIPIPAGWDRRPCAYVLFGPPYDDLAGAARARGWPVEHLPGGHLHQVVDPDGVARLLTALGDRMVGTQTAGAG
jgi:pimeloyl-ACP methyl ester carboxylesterase